MRLIVGAACAFAVLAFLTLLNLASSPVSLRVSPSVALAPATIQPTIRVEPKEDNRLVVYGLYGEMYVQTSRADLFGLRGPITIFPVPWKAVPIGEYLCRADVYNSTGKIVATASARVEVQ